jgi:hypothetical protein
MGYRSNDSNVVGYVAVAKVLNFGTFSALVFTYKTLIYLRFMHLIYDKRVLSHIGDWRPVGDKHRSAFNLAGKSLSSLHPPSLDNTTDEIFLIFVIFP